MTLYHGSHKNETLVAHVGLCLTDREEVAQVYAGSQGWLHVVAIDLGSMVVEECDGYDHDSNSCPADDVSFCLAAAARGVDVLAYQDEDERGRRHVCYRLVSDKAISALSVQK